MTILSNYLRSADPIIKSAANLTINAMSAFQSNQITASEYSEIMENILDLATDLQAFREIQKTVTAKNSGGSSPTPEQEVGL